MQMVGKPQNTEEADSSDKFMHWILITLLLPDTVSLHLHAQFFGTKLPTTWLQNRSLLGFVSLY